MLKQISIYTENKRGAARGIFHVLAQENINVLSLVSSDSGEFGTMRIIVSETEAAVTVLKQKRYLCKEDPVLAVELEDVPGAMDSFLAQVEDMYINIDYLYVCYMRAQKVPVIIVHCEDLDIVEKALQNKGYRVY